MNHSDHSTDNGVVEILNKDAKSPVVLVCEHASSYIPAEFEDLGLSEDALKSHAVWDPGAMALTTRMADTLDAVLVASKVSRLVYDCNRPPEAPDAMPGQSEVIAVPGNLGLSAHQRAARVARYYQPFRTSVAKVMAHKAAPILVTLHSFTPVYHGVPRAVEIGVLHDSDDRLAEALLTLAKGMVPYDVRRNQPYGPEHGVTHTLKEHALPAGHLNVMLEVRSDLIADASAQDRMARTLSDWVAQACVRVGADPCGV
ncbi:N-formylglutamate amidohydrolase [Roseobacter weihaiensis]|uniref:N-formylglutamate amidohydrolase n=1 Tax=Roseobacter weihaiensis TaxID=2763262 RepID=UPI001D0BA3F0|nr:N-formylglutamate amidohydrolase [Roseobacter sp. H9]